MKIKIVPTGSNAPSFMFATAETQAEVNLSQLPVEIDFLSISSGGTHDDAHLIANPDVEPEVNVVITPVARLTKQTGTHSISTSNGFAGSGTIEELAENLRNFGIEVGFENDVMIFTNTTSQDIQISMQAQGRSGKLYVPIEQENTSIQLDSKNAMFRLERIFDFKYSQNNVVHYGNTSVQTLDDNETYDIKNILGFKSEFTQQIDSLVIASHIKKIYPYSFARQSTATHLELANVEVIENNAFRHWDNLKVLTLPASLKEIGDYAFSNLSKLEKIIIHATTPPKVNSLLQMIIHDGTTGGMELLKKIPTYVPDESLELYRNHPRWGDNVINGFSKADYRPMSELINENLVIVSELESLPY